jgi:DNA-binding IclR family transcriptional regulator
MPEAPGARGADAPEARGGVAAVERALAILGAFRDGEPSLSLAELAARTGLYKSTILRLLGTLEATRCVERQADARWALGPMLFRWGALYARARPAERHLPAALRALAEASGETASFWVRHGTQRLCLARVRGSSRIRDDLAEGDLLPLPHGAGGRVLSAPDPRALGVVATFGERNPETAAIACAVFDTHGLAGAVGISGPRERIASREAAHRATVAEGAAALTRRLGGDLGVNA